MTAATARATRTKKRQEKTNNSKPFDRQFWDHLAVPYSDIPSHKSFSFFPFSCYSFVCVLSRKSLSRPDRFFPEKALHCCTAPTSPQSEFREIWQSARGTDEGQTRNVSLDSKENEKRIRLQTHTHTQTQTTYAHQTRFRSAKKRNQHAEMGTGHIFSHKLPKEKKKNEKRKTREKQEHRHERGKMVDALVVDATLASTFKMIKRGGG